jgi:2-C-methyl-D-erythritol 4-phosphate cytidylyltransferase
MVEWSIAAFRVADSVRSIVVACPPGHVHDLAGSDIGVVDGGATRAQSVSNALRAVGTELVAIHDAARPLVTAELIEEVVATLVANPDAAGAIAATPITDTIKQVGKGEVSDEGSNRPSRDRLKPFGPHRASNPSTMVELTLDRERLWAAQTPQAFRVEALRAVLDGDSDQVAAATDEAMLVEGAGGRVLIHPSSAENLKVTTPLDLKIAELLLEERSAQ